MNAAHVQPREVVLQFGMLPCSLVAPQLDCVAAVLAAHRALTSAATLDAQGNSECCRLQRRPQRPPLQQQRSSRRSRRH